MLKKHNCERCTFRKKYDDRPASFLGRLWRWHIGWCPGWNKYYGSLSATEQAKLKAAYGLGCTKK